VSGQPPPLVSIGLPVYNEARFLDAALASLRRQTFANLEIIVCDNASTDATPAVCERHAAQDSRIRLERSATNIGVIANFRRALDSARGEYFMWAGGHDLWNADYVAACLAQLQAHPDACLAYGATRWIGSDDEPLARESGGSDTRGLAPAARFFTVFWGNMHPVMGLIRLRHLRACRPLPALVGGDLVLLSELVLRGDFLHTDQAVWSRRELRAETHHADKVRRYRSAESGIAASRLARAFPLLELPLALIGVVLRSSLPALDKAAVLAALVPSFAVRYLVGRRQRYR
jgi:glycosyltransferase involved in cell wall biosynthesis